MIKNFSKIVKAQGNLSLTFKRFSDNKAVTIKENSSFQNKISYYENGQLISRNQIVLRSKENIEDYVMKVIKNYFRTTHKNGLTLDSELKQHGLDSLDTMEIVMTIEEDLNYKISAESLTNFFKVKHFVNYIEQVEQFKEKFGKDPLP